MSNYISLFEEFIGIINWNLLAEYAFKLGIDTKSRAFFTNQHLATMIYFHICEHESLCALKQGMSKQMKDLLPEISLSTLSNHNNNRDYRAFLPIMDQLITLCLNALTKGQRLSKFGSVKMIDSTTVSMCLKFLDWYKKRWDIELFLKWIKQHCKIKTLIGHSENAVRLQMITGIITYLLIRLLHHEAPKKMTL